MSAAKNPVGGNWLPVDLIIQVFLRIPSRNHLVRFRCVSKGIRNLIDSPLFKYRWEVFHYSVSDDSNIMFIDNGRLLSIDFPSPGNPNSGEETQVLFPENMLNHRYIGCCRGIVCFAVYGGEFRLPKRYILFNPSNGTIQNCRDLTNMYQPGGKYYYEPLCCGFDNSKPHDDFKIVCLRQQYYVVDGKVVKIDVYRRVDVYSMRRDSWRQINVEEFGFGHLDSVGIWIKGATHLLWRRVSNVCIVALDLQSESSKRMMLPPQLVGKKDYIGLNDLGGRLCVCDFSFNTKMTTFWVMDEYGDDASWSRLFNIAIPSPRPNGFLGYFPRQDGGRLLCFTKNPGSWYWFNTHDGSKENIYNVPDRHLHDSWICVGRSSLRLPYSDM